MNKNINVNYTRIYLSNFPYQFLCGDFTIAQHDADDGEIEEEHAQPDQCGNEEKPIQWALSSRHGLAIIPRRFDLFWNAKIQRLLQLDGEVIEEGQPELPVNELRQNGQGQMIGVENELDREEFALRLSKEKLSKCETF